MRKNCSNVCLRAALLLFFTAPLLAAQQDNSGIVLSAQDAAKIQGIRIVSAVPQEDIKAPSEKFIRAQIVNTNTPVRGGGGIIGAIIGAAIGQAIVNNQIQKRLEEIALAWPKIVDSVADYDFRDELWTELEKLFQTDTRFRIAESVFIKGERPYLETPETVRGVAVDAVLDLNTEYALGAGMLTMQVTTKAILKLRGSEKEIYRAIYSFTTPPLPAGDFESAAMRWSANNGELYRAAMQLAVAQTVRMLQLDLLDAKAPAALVSPVKTLRASDFDRNQGFSNPEIGNVVEQRDDIYIVRDKTNNMKAEMQGKTFAPKIAARAPANTATARDDAQARAVPARTPPAGAPPAARESQLTLDNLRDLLPAQ